MKKNRSVLLFSLLMVMSTLMAQVNIRVQAPSEVIQGDRFRVSYVVNSSDIDDFKVDAFDGLVELYGPSRSSSSSFSIVNGKTTSSSSVTYTMRSCWRRRKKASSLRKTNVSGFTNWINGPRLEMVPLFLRETSMVKLYVQNMS